MRRPPAPNDFAGWVSQLAFASSRQRARAHLVTTGAPALPALRRGLRHPKAIVRQQCVRILDQLVDEGSVADVVLALDDDDPGVRARALHTLACDRCKQGECRPGEDLWVPRALELLRDGDADLRAAAMEALGNVAPHRPEVVAALLAAVDRETDKGLRGLARRHAHVRS